MSKGVCIGNKIFRFLVGVGYNDSISAEEKNTDRGEMHVPQEKFLERNAR